MTYTEFITRFHIHLTDQQLAAVKSVNNPTLLLAVPGSGKTTVLVTRLGYMVYCCGIEPERILTVTYTVAATKDMQSRCASIFGNELAERLEFRTINGICAKIISYYGNCVGKRAYELITDESYKAKLLSAIYIEQMKEYPTESDLKNLSTQITYIKNRMLSQKEIVDLGKEQELPLYEIYQEYCGQMRSQSLMDYDDQMIYALTMLKRTPQVLSHFQDVYQYLCVDEAQDTSKIQHKIIEMLAGRYDNLFMVGDEDQSIYGFRAAYPEALLEFEENHANAQVLLMEENFRSSANIVAAADRFIQKNEFRHKKSMKASREAGTEVQMIAMKSREEQYDYLAQMAAECKDITAVLYRDNESILPVVDLLERRGIPYRIKNADLSFFTHRSVVDIQNIISFAEDQMNTELFMQIYYKIGLYINKAAAMEACRNSAEKGLSVLDAALRFGKIAPGTQRAVKSMQTHMQMLLKEPAAKAVDRIRCAMGYDEYLDRSHIKDNKVKIVEAIASNEPSALRLIDRLQELSIVIKEKNYIPECNLILSTIHSSKGLEYDSVYLMDIVDGIFPEHLVINRKTSSEEELKTYEEERRIFYVGVTRARNRLGIFDVRGKSTFCRELSGLELIPQVSSLQKKSKKHIIDEAEYLEKLQELHETGYVKHKKYGEGKIRSIEGDTLEIDFDYKTVKCSLRFMMEHGLIE